MATSHIVQISSKSFIWVAPLISSIVVPTSVSSALTSASISAISSAVDA
jgi:competence transcription factor ComK